MELARAYDPKRVEDRIYAGWMERDLFRAVPGEGTPYCITIPPPNITGSLHMGHALNNTVLDTLTRWHRMLGHNTLCLPGTDHAGIATQNVVERELAKEGLTRHDLGREAFIERCWEWRRQYGDRIYLQFQKLGCSYDWSRARFTMDEPYVDAIHEEFLRWWDRGLIYRGTRVVNWCPRCRSAISDIEVETEDRPGKLYHFRYPLEDGRPADEHGRKAEPDHPARSAGWITIATTRPETLLGDTAVAVNPDDPRYRHLIGRNVRLPLVDRLIPVIADEYAKIEFGTGAVKVTPAHDLDDFEVGLRHGLPQVVVIGEDGCMTEAAGSRYAGMDRFEARELVVGDMEAAGLLERVEDYTVKTPHCDRCKTVLEPLLSEQWFVKQKELAQPAIEAVRQGRIRFFPERYRAVYLDWMENIRDWCISRQLWWGHRIPVWWTEDRRCAPGRSAEEAAARLGVPVESLRQDEDVLDTWFSSALWPHATLGWPRDTEDLRFWYPTSLLSTAQEILFLWVARMVMTGLDFMGDVPFRDVYVHATVLDSRGERMSKSKGNGVDPLDLIEKHGADALRFYLLQNAGKNQDIRFREDAVRVAGTFCNKLWNASRFVIGAVQGAAIRPLGSGNSSDGRPAISPDDPGLSTADRWILARLQETTAAVNAALDARLGGDASADAYNMDDAARVLYSFVWDDFCDWQIEISKPRLRSTDEERDVAASVLHHVLECVLRLLHPLIPFITEELWQALRSASGTEDERITNGRPGQRRSGASIMVAPYPLPDPAWTGAAGQLARERMAVVIEATRALRNLRAEAGVAPGARIQGAIVPGSRAAASALSDSTDLIAGLARLSSLRMADSAPGGEGRWVGTPIQGGEVFLEIGDALDVERERERLGRELAALDREMEKARAKLANAQFVERAPAEVVERERAHLMVLEEKRARLEARRHTLGL